MEDLIHTIDLKPRIPELPSFEFAAKTDVRYTIVSPYVSSHIHWDGLNKELVYDIEEPLLNTEEKLFFDKLREQVQKVVNEDLVSGRTLDDVLTYIDKVARWSAEELKLVLKDEVYNKLFYYLYREFIGLNKIEPLLKDPFVEGIEYTGLNMSIFVTHKVYGSLRTNVVYNDIKSVVELVQKLAQRCNKKLSASSPTFEGVLSDGSKVNCSYYSEIENKGPVFSIKKVKRVHWTPIQLLDLNIISAEMAAYLWMLVENKFNILIIGEKDSGKTSLLNSLRMFMPFTSNVFGVNGSGIRDKAKKKWYQRAKKEDEQKSDVSGMIKDTFKKSPDYILAESLSKRETLTLFQGMIPDYGTALALRSKTVDEAIGKLLNESKLSQKLVDNIDVIVIMSNEIVNTKEVKRLVNVTEVFDGSGEGSKKHNAFLWDEKSNKFYFKTDNQAFEKIMEKEGVSKEDLLHEFELRTQIVHKMLEKKISEPYAVQKAINNYYENPGQVMTDFGIMK